MSVGHFLFSFSGRANRAKMWLFFLIAFIYICIAVATVFSVIGLDTLQAVAQQRVAPDAIAARLATGGAVLAVLGLLDLLLIYCGLAVAAKRLHDRNKSAWWLLIFFALPFVLNIARFVSVMGSMHTPGVVPMNPVATLAGGAALIIDIWAFVELYCLRGTVGDNAYGPDPLAG